MKNPAKQPTPATPVRTNHAYGKGPVWRETKSIIVMCVCGNKYIKTRPGQSTCIRCLHKH